MIKGTIDEIENDIKPTQEREIRMIDVHFIGPRSHLWVRNLDSGWLSLIERPCAVCSLN